MITHKAGKKFAGSHTTLIEETIKLVELAENMTEVTKIVLGPIKNMKGLKLSVKFHEIGAGWKIIVCGKSSKQEIFFYTTDRDIVKDILNEKLKLNLEQYDKKSAK